MRLEQLTLCNYRNIGQADLTPDPGFNVLWGDNAQGKTNLLEAIYLLGHLRSFRGSRGEELVQQGKTAGRVKATVTSLEVRRQVELTLGGEGRSARIDGKEVRSPGLFMRSVRPVLFAPEEVTLVKGYPAGRRALLDRAIFQGDPNYLERAQLYARCLRQRNQLLRLGRADAEIEPWTEQTVQAGARLRSDRLCYLERLLPLLRETYRQISGDREEAELLYPAAEGGEAEQATALRRDFERLHQRERAFGQSLAGPHRDDPLFLVDGKPLRLYGSQGQQRSFILAFKTAQVIDLERRLGEPPVLLLDDMTSELDRRRQGFFFRFLLERRGQVFITTTDPHILRAEGVRRARFFRIEGGALRPDPTE
jgi:DNA replication and repair protein RecF